MTTVGGEGYDAQSGYGTVFKITPGGTFTSIHSFNGSDGWFAKGELTRGSDGNFYGTSSQGGAFFNAAKFQSGFGSIFKITPDGSLTTLHSFAGSAANDGSIPYGGPIQASDGSFYGTTEGGGPSYTGIAYRIAGPTPQLVSAASRKTHGNAGTFDVDLALDGSGTECRSGGTNGDYQLVMTFALPVTFTSATVSSGTGGVAVALASANQIFVNLTGVTNAQKITLTLVGVNDGANRGDVPVSMAVLIGDTTRDGFVNSADIAQTKSQSGTLVSSSNFREDVTVDGNLNSADIGLVKSKSGTALP
jgi:uncharacterized repeat protein (TIGR03803 family)